MRNIKRQLLFIFAILRQLFHLPAILFPIPDVKVALRERNLNVIVLQSIINSLFNLVNKINLLLDKHPEGDDEVYRALSKVAKEHLEALLLLYHRSAGGTNSVVELIEIGLEQVSHLVDLHSIGHANGQFHILIAVVFSEVLEILVE